MSLIEIDRPAHDVFAYATGPTLRVFALGTGFDPTLPVRGEQCSRWASRDFIGRGPVTNMARVAVVDIS